MVVRADRGDGPLLQPRQLAAELHRQPLVGRPLVLGYEPAAGARDRAVELREQAARKVEVGQILLVAPDQPRRLMR